MHHSLSKAFVGALAVAFLLIPPSYADSTAPQCNYFNGTPPQVRPVQQCDSQVTDIFDAIEKNCPDRVEALIQADPKLVETYKDQIYGTMLYITPLNLAIVRGDLEITNLLLDHGAKLTTSSDMDCSLNQDIVICDSPNRLPIHFAVRAGFQDIITALIKHGADVNSEGGNEYYRITAYCDAVKSDYFTRQFLIDHGADTSKCDVLMPAITSADYCDAAFAIQHAGIHPKSDHMVNLIERTKGENLDLANLLLDSGLDPNALNSYTYNAVNYGDFPNLAASYQKPQTLRLLINRGTTVSQGSQRFILHNMNLDFDSYVFLVNHGAAVKEPDAYGNLPLQEVPDGPDGFKVAQYLVETLGADVNAAPNGSNPPIINLFENRRTDPRVFEYLHEKGADVNANGSKGTHALEELVDGLWPFTVQGDPLQLTMLNEFLSWGANPNLQDNDGNAPIIFSPKLEYAQVLAKAGAQINVYSNNGASILDRTYECGGNAYISVDYDFMEFAFKAGLDPNKYRMGRGFNGQTAEMMPWWFGFLEDCWASDPDQLIKALEFLRRHKADFNLKSASGHCAKDLVYPQTEEWLKKHGGGKCK